MEFTAQQAPAKPNARFLSLDGMRGIAALIVFAHHAMALLYGPLAGINEYGWKSRPAGALGALHHLPVGWMFNGAFAVSFFFVLSGFVLTLAIGATPSAPRIARLMSYRLLRLFPLVLIATALGFALFHVSVHSLDELRYAAGVDSQGYIAASLLQHATFAQAIKQLAYDIWCGARPDTLFDPPLWSIGIELQGSLLVYILAGVFWQTPRRSAKYWIGVPVGLFLIGPSALSFLAGMYIAEHLSEDGSVLPVSSTQLSALSAGALIWASVHPWNRHLWLPLPFNPPELLDTVMSTGCAVILVAAGLQLSAFRRALMCPPIRFLGHASYGLYVVHVPLLYAATGPLFTLFRDSLGYHAAAALTFGLILAASLAIGYALVTYVDTPLSRVSKRWVSAWLSKEVL